MRDHCLSSISTFSNVEPLDTYSGTPVGSQHFSICKREITMIIETSRHAPALFVATQPGKPNHDLFLTHTKCFLCLNLTRLYTQRCHNMKLFQHISGGLPKWTMPTFIMAIGLLNTAKIWWVKMQETTLAKFWFIGLQSLILKNVPSWNPRHVSPGVWGR